MKVPAVLTGAVGRPWSPVRRAPPRLRPPAVVEPVAGRRRGGHDRALPRVRRPGRPRAPRSGERRVPLLRQPGGRPGHLGNAGPQRRPGGARGPDDRVRRRRHRSGHDSAGPRRRGLVVAGDDGPGARHGGAGRSSRPRGGAPAGGGARLPASADPDRRPRLRGRPPRPAAGAGRATSPAARLHVHGMRVLPRARRPLARLRRADGDRGRGDRVHRAAGQPAGGAEGAGRDRVARPGVPGHQPVRRRPARGRPVRRRRHAGRRSGRRHPRDRAVRRRGRRRARVGPGGAARDGVRGGGPVRGGALPPSFSDSGHMWQRLSHRDGGARPPSGRRGP